MKISAFFFSCIFLPAIELIWKQKVLAVLMFANSIVDAAASIM